MAQMTVLASFGLASLIAVHSHPPRTFKTHIEPKYNRKYWLVYKNKKEKGNTL